MHGWRGFAAKIAGALLAVFLLTFVTFLALHGDVKSSCACSYAGYLDAESLVAESQAIVLVQYVSQRTEKVTIEANPVSGHGGGERREKVTTYRVIDVLKGDGSIGSTIETWSGPEEKGQQLVLFLRDLPYGGESRWTITGEPGFAVVKNDQLLFKASLKQYEVDVAAHNLPLPVEGSVAPFSVTLPQLRAMLQD